MSVASDDSAATTYVYAAERNALDAAGCVLRFVIPDAESQAMARRLASTSTGRVMKLNSVVVAKRAMPASSIPGNICTVNMPISNIHVMIFDANDTTGTSADLIFSGAYAFACCTACPHSCAATAAAAMLAELKTPSLRFTVFVTGL